MKIFAAIVGAAGDLIALTKQEPSGSIVLSAGGTLTGGQDTDAEFAADIESADGEGAHANGRIIKIMEARMVLQITSD